MGKQSVFDVYANSSLHAVKTAGCMIRVSELTAKLNNSLCFVLWRQHINPLAISDIYTFILMVFFILPSFYQEVELRLKSLLTNFFSCASWS